ncbi:MAG: ATP-binding protein [Steroidobacteraceae bacterium]
MNQQIVALEQQLEYMRQQQEMLLYTLSHDLRTPVMTILGFTDMLLGDLKDSSDEQMTRQYLEHIRNSATRQASLIESLLKLSRISRQGLHPEPIDLTRIAFDYWQSQPELADNKRIAVKLQPTPPAVGDRQLLTLVVHALLDNAVKFTSKLTAPEICFGAEQTDGMATYFVRDNGAGFNAERAERLFQPFRRLHSSKDYEGLGMGLATTAMIIQRHHGRLWADSAVDQGTTMRFTVGNV